MGKLDILVSEAYREEVSINYLSFHDREKIQSFGADEPDFEQKISRKHFQQNNSFQLQRVIIGIT